MNEEFSLIKISTELLNKIEKRIQDTEFKTAQDYISFVLEEVIKDDDDQEDNLEETFSEEDEEKIKGRLKALGYLG